MEDSWLSEAFLEGVFVLFLTIFHGQCASIELRMHAGGCWARKKGKSRGDSRICRSVTSVSGVLSNFLGAPLLDRRTLTMDQSLYIALTIFQHILVFLNLFKAYRHTFQLFRNVISVRPWDYGVRWWLKLCDFAVIHLTLGCMMGFVLQIRWQDS